jgi:hypothetical protein
MAIAIGSYCGLVTCHESFVGAPMFWQHCESMSEFCDAAAACGRAEAVPELRA